MKSILFLITCLLFVQSYAQTTFSYTLKGRLSSSAHDGATIGIRRYDNNKFIDTIKIIGDTFLYNGTADSAMYCRMEGAGTYANFIIEEGEIHVDMLTHIFPSGTLLNERYAQAKKSEAQIYTKLDSTRRAIINDKSISREQRIKRQNELDDIKTQEQIQCSTLKPFILQNSNNELGVAISQAYFCWASPKSLDEIYPYLGEWILSRQQIKEQISQINVSRKMSPGSPFIDFEAEDLEGNKVRLSDYVGKGKYVIVDFSASWCAPCLAELPNLKDIYERYKGEQFDMVTVAVWDKPENSQKMFKNHEINWKGIINAGMTPMKLYGFSGIPRIMLIGPDGNIIDNQLRGSTINEKVAKVLNIQ